MNVFTYTVYCKISLKPVFQIKICQQQSMKDADHAQYVTGFIFYSSPFQPLKGLSHEMDPGEIRFI
jgi:hypothetical protein